MDSPARLEGLPYFLTHQIMAQVHQKTAERSQDGMQNPAELV